MPTATASSPPSIVVRVSTLNAENIADELADFGPDRSARLALAKYGNYKGYVDLTPEEEGAGARLLSRFSRPSEMREVVRKEGLCLCSPDEIMDLDNMERFLRQCQGSQISIFPGGARRLKAFDSFSSQNGGFSQKSIWASPEDPRTCISKFFHDRYACRVQRMVLTVPETSTYSCCITAALLM